MTSKKQVSRQKDIVDLLKHDHREVESLFKKITGKKTSQNLTQQEKSFKELRHALTLHSEAEERFLYPRIEDIQQLRHIAFESYEEHALVRRLLGELDAIDIKSDEWKGKITVLKELVEHHVEEEEDEMFPKLRKLVDKQELSRIAEEVRQFKEAEESDQVYTKFPSAPETEIHP